MSEQRDLLIIGAGSAGSALALQAARCGFKPLVLESKTLSEAGARWVNGVHAKAFELAQLDAPQWPERRGQLSPEGGHTFHLVAGRGTERVKIENTGLYEVDMRHLIARLQREAQALGVEFRPHTRVESITFGEVQTPDSTIRSPLIIDASGLKSLFRPEAHAPQDLCAAAQGVYRVTHPDKARAWFVAQGCKPGDTLCYSGLAGGYSILSARLEGKEDALELSILSGSLPACGAPAGRALRDDFIASLDWVGERLFGGHAPIPLARPTRLAFRQADQAIIRFGDAGRMVFAAHGSGIGAQLVGSKLLAEPLRKDGAWGAEYFERTWKRRFGLAFLGADLARRASMKLKPELSATLFRYGLFPKALVKLMFRAGI